MKTYCFITFIAWCYILTIIFHVNKSSSLFMAMRKVEKPECKPRPLGVEEATEAGENTGKRGQGQIKDLWPLSLTIRFLTGYY